MVKELMHDPLFLGRKSTPATKEDLLTAQDLLDTLEAAGCADVITQQRSRLGIVPQAIRCDYYDWCAGKRMGNPYLGEYMAQYSWSEYTNAALQQMT